VSPPLAGLRAFPSGPTRLSALAARCGAALIGEDDEVDGLIALDGAPLPRALCWSTRPVEAGPRALLSAGPRPDAGPTLVHPAPREAFTTLLWAMFPPQAGSGVHPSAVVEPSAQLGVGVGIGPLAVIGAGCVIGAGSQIGPGAVLHPGVRLGAGCVIGAHAVLGGPGFGFSADQGRPRRLPQLGGLWIGDRVEVGAHSCVDRGSLGDTIIEDDVKIDNLVQVAHNVHVGRGAILAGQVGVAGSAQIGAGAVLGGQVGVADHAQVGAGARVGAQAGVVRAVPAGAAVWGTPAIPRRLALEAAAALRRLPALLRAR
jgi:UDP-3-O-[3-hydroxymyristoyl] glucosamine N-acyltransferase